MLFRNINQVNGLCNETRLQVLNLKKNVICVAVLTGTNIGDKNLHFKNEFDPFKFRYAIQILEKTISSSSMFCNDNQ